MGIALVALPIVTQAKSTEADTTPFTLRTTSYDHILCMQINAYK